jgi:hypothetical protein
VFPAIYATIADACRVRTLLVDQVRRKRVLQLRDFGMPPDTFDRFEPMFSWPLPVYIDSEEKKVTSVGGLLMAFIASPAHVANWKGAMDIALFAAALLASRIEDRAAPNWRGRAAAKWLAGSLPTHVFSQDIEALIWEPEGVLEEATAGGRR